MDETVLLSKLLNINEKLNPNNLDDLKDLIYILFVNQTVLQGQDSNINEILDEIMSKVILSKQNNKNDDALRFYMSPRVIRRNKFNL